MGITKTMKRLWLFGLCIVLILVSVGIVNAEPVVLIGHYGFENKTAESQLTEIINQGNLTQSLGSIQLDTSNYKEGTASGYIGGNNAHVLINDDIYKVDSINENKTFSFWFMTNESNVLGNSIFTVTGTSTANVLQINQYDGNITFVSAGISAPTFVSYSDTNTSDGLWHFVVISYNTVNATTWIDKRMTGYTVTTDVYHGIVYHSGSTNDNAGFVDAGANTNGKFYLDRFRIYNGSMNNEEIEAEFWDVAMEDFFIYGNYTFFNTTTITESTQATYSINISNTTDLFSYDYVNASFFFNNTQYALSDLYFDGDHYVFETNFTVPYDYGSFENYDVGSYWELNFSSGANEYYENITINQTLVLETGRVAICNDTFYDAAFNFTFKDEMNQSAINAFANFDFDYNILDRHGSVASLVYSSPSMSQNYSFCIQPADATFEISGNVLYYADDYPQRNNYLYNVSYTNQTTMNVLYLLLNTKGIYARFKTVGSLNSPISGVLGEMSKEISGISTMIEKENSDSSGLLTFWVNPDNYYTFTFSKLGYTTQSFFLRPTTNDIYTVQMAGSSTTNTNSSTGAGIMYAFIPSASTLLNNTAYDFGASVNSTGLDWTITNCTVRLLDENNTELTYIDDGVLTSGCYLTLNYNTGNLTKILNQFTYTLNGTYPITITKTYAIAYLYAPVGSLKYFLDDMRAFSGAGFNDFTRLMLGCIVTFILIILICQQTGIVDPDIIIIISVVCIFLFSYIGWFTMNSIALNPGLTDLLEFRQYIIFYLSLIFGAGLIIWRHN